jgi:hypothetical protein
MRRGDYLRLLVPVEGLTPDQRYRAVKIATRAERRLAQLLANGGDPDRLMAKLEGYFPE